MYCGRSVRLGWYLKTKMLFICIHCEMALAYCTLTYIELVVAYFFVINHGNWVWNGCKSIALSLSHYLELLPLCV